AAAALDPEVRLVLLDGKLVELAAWAACADRSVGVDVAEAIEVLNQLRAEMDKRYRQLLAAGKRKVTRDDGLPLWLVVVDELAHYTTCDLKPDKGARKLGDQFSDALRDLVSRGRAAGIIVVAATQKPSHDIVPTALRDLFGFRWALRCSTPHASDTILGAGWASNGYTASDIDPSARGVGLLLQEGGIPTRIRSYHLDDHTIKKIAQRAAWIREDYHYPTVLGGGAA
ncbi:MAG: FtsK/SpoIIIE domain-containing protein, partial [Actinomycetota bacterium]|nr:FtsK/SpoIIIE domain-containing protein [Actinomycetota bacterium]